MGLQGRKGCLLKIVTYFLCVTNDMETITDNMYMNLIHKHSRLLLSTQKRLQRSQILLLDFDVYLKNRSSQINHCLFYVYKDSLPDYCSNRLHEFTSPVCIKHLDLCVLTS